jgi:quercetin dioxygenase-like cupin family protein
MEVMNWDQIPVEPLTDKIRRQLVTGENEMMARVLLDKGAVVHRHAHESEQITIIIEGAMRLFIGEPAEEFVLTTGQFIVIPPNVPHSAEILEDTVDIDVFSPIRQDWLDGTDTYFQKEE